VWLKIPLQTKPKSMNNPSLCLGGHSFIAELGNDPEPDFDTQCALVATCLDRGIARFDTTYAQERVRLGACLAALNRRAEARISVWNFFFDQHPLPGPKPLQPHHAQTILDELQTDYIDIFVVHNAPEAQLESDFAQVLSWGFVKEMAIGMANEGNFTSPLPYSSVFAPYNLFNQEAEGLFTLAQSRKIHTVAMSPFIRGYKIDEIIGKFGKHGNNKAEIADLLLRWVAEKPFVDEINISMRLPAWVETNQNSIAKGSLTEAEKEIIKQWQI
jgi:aryl-alcohol dehydrogenase-like predicted oxidoreductase